MHPGQKFNQFMLDFNYRMSYGALEFKDRASLPGYTPRLWRSYYSSDPRLKRLRLQIWLCAPHALYWVENAALASAGYVPIRKFGWTFRTAP